MPVYMTAEYLAEAQTIPLNHARIGYDNVVPDSVITVSSFADGFPPAAVKTETTWEGWRPTSLQANMRISFPASRSFNYIGIGGHSLENHTISVDSSPDNIVWTDITDQVTPTDNKAIMFLTTATTAAHIRIVIHSGSGSLPVISSVYCGTTLDMIRPFYSGFTPDSFAKTAVVRPNKSEGGQWLGRSVVRKGVSQEYQWANLDIDWYRANFDPFAQSAVTKPFFVAWNALQEPEDAAYVWLPDGNVRPSLSGTLDLMDVGFSAMGVE